MIALIISTSILGVLALVLGFTTINLMRKQEKAEDVLISYM